MRKKDDRVGTRNIDSLNQNQVPPPWSKNGFSGRDCPERGCWRYQVSGCNKRDFNFCRFFPAFSRSQSLTNVQRRSKRRQTSPLDPLDRHGWKPLSSCGWNQCG